MQDTTSDTKTTRSRCRRTRCPWEGHHGAQNTLRDPTLTPGSIGTIPAFTAEFWRHTAHRSAFSKKSTCQCHHHNPHHGDHEEGAETGRWRQRKRKCTRDHRRAKISVSQIIRLIQAPGSSVNFDAVVEESERRCYTTGSLCIEQQEHSTAINSSFKKIIVHHLPWWTVSSAFHLSLWLAIRIWWTYPSGWFAANLKISKTDQLLINLKLNRVWIHLWSLL